MKRTIRLNFLVIFIILHNLTCIASDNYHIGTRSSGMSNASVMLYDFWAVHHNQAGLTKMQDPAIGFHYENRFLLNELSLKACAIVLPTKSGVFGLEVSQWGFSQYSESKVGVGFAKTLGENFSSSIQIDYVNIHQALDFGNIGIVAIEAGMIAEPSDNLFIGAHVFNLTMSKHDAYGIPQLPTILRLGGAYKFSDDLLIAVETEKHTNEKAFFKTGLEYGYSENLLFRFGVATNSSFYANSTKSLTSTSSMSFGLGYLLEKLQIDFAVTYNQLLGISPHASMVYLFN